MKVNIDLNRCKSIDAKGIRGGDFIVRIFQQKLGVWVAAAEALLDPPGSRRMTCLQTGASEIMPVTTRDLFRIQKEELMLSEANNV